jgi:hypothetical protein
MEGIVPTDIAREKQAQLARQLASLTGELATLEASGVDTEATLNQLINQLADPGRAYRNLDDARRRIYNQAWFTRIYIDAMPDDPDKPLQTEADKTVLADALDSCRQIILAAENKSAAPEGTAAIVVDIGSRHVQGSIKNPLVVLREAFSNPSAPLIALMTPPRNGWSNANISAFAQPNEVDPRRYPMNRRLSSTEVTQLVVDITLGESRCSAVG